MDPDDTLARLISTLCADFGEPWGDGDEEDAREAFESLLSWRKRGGFAPADPRPIPTY